MRIFATTKSWILFFCRCHDSLWPTSDKFQWNLANSISRIAGRDDGELDLSASIAVGCWRGRSNVSLLVTKTEAVQYLQRISLFEGDLGPVVGAVEEKLQVSEPSTDLELLPGPEFHGISEGNA
jgi:hypothetical protein